MYEIRKFNLIRCLCFMYLILPSFTTSPLSHWHFNDNFNVAN